jgi:hypothetical protein
MDTQRPPILLLSRPGAAAACARAIARRVPHQAPQAVYTPLGEHFVNHIQKASATHPSRTRRHTTMADRT